ncbi:MAG: carbohydrate kinase [Acidobacteria bacterium]|nr:MAG: carbohydrate kinase [Acidobacteriota bacterium]
MALPAHLVVGLGEALWDLLPAGKHLGGAPLNFAYIASLLGEHALIASRIGNDPLGAEIEAELAGRDLDTSGIQTDSKLPTGTVDVRFRGGQPEYEIRQPAAWDALEWTPKWHEIAAKCDAVCFGTLAQRAPKSRATIQNFLENTRPTCLRVFDINLRRPFYDRETIESSLHLATILKLNDLELPEIAAIVGLKGGSIDALMQEMLHRFGLKTVLVTRGEHGATAANEEKIALHPGFKVRVSDTIGAGDAFTAAAIHCILRGIDLDKTLAFANKWASWVASQAGAMPPIAEQQRLKMLSEVVASAS